MTCIDDSDKYPSMLYAEFCHIFEGILVRNSIYHSHRLREFSTVPLFQHLGLVEKRRSRHCEKDWKSTISGLSVHLIVVSWLRVLIGLTFK